MAHSPLPDDNPPPEELHVASGSVRDDDRVRTLARTADVLQDCIEQLYDRDREGLVTGGAERIAKLESRLHACREELTRLRASSDAEGRNAFTDRSGDNEVRAQASEFPSWLAELPPLPPIWSALRFVAERMSLDAPWATQAGLEEVTPELAEAAATIAGFLVGVAFFRRAPRAACARVEALRAAWDSIPGREGWFDALCGLFRAHTGRDFPGKTERHRVWFVLRALRVNADLRGASLPRVLCAPDDAQLQRAEAVLRETSPTGPRRGRPLSHETRARKFAHAFKLYPPNRRDVHRPR